ncbi:hypothetical protein NQ317_004381 [Molorchus minor]|uniref:Protein kinase domain-containing protein n=1 Tax=Molorchus minor TaxID=1323400 RepID=A0ABQ9J7P9_9CUCU|nr:hypothetical protein NQ317_004381 [Molorchus minor]
MASRSVTLKELKVSDLKKILKQRDSDTKEKKSVLQHLKNILEEGENLDTYLFDNECDIKLKWIFFCIEMENNFNCGNKINTLKSSSSASNFKTRTQDSKIAGLYDLECTLGKGHFATVKLARHVFTGEKVAVKVIEKDKLDDLSKAHLFQEIRCMKLVQHPNIVRLYEVIDTATKLYLVLELADGGDLYEYILKHNAGLPEEIAKEYFMQIVQAISYCHQLHVVHRDLKPENVVFFKKQGVVKLTDFAYSAPEILLGESYEAPAVDVWSLGVILYMLVCGQPPFQEANDSETLTMIMDCKYYTPGHVSDICQRLISRMLLRDPSKRATLTEIINHPWLTDGKQNFHNIFPLVSKELISKEDHNLILQKMANGKIATDEEIFDCLEKDAYNHITATYYLLAERRLRSKRQESMIKRLEQLKILHNSESQEKTVKANLLNVPHIPREMSQRNRKCSIVQEDDEEVSSCSRQENFGISNQRESHSKGRFNLTLQEEKVESDEKINPGKVAENEIYCSKFKTTNKNVNDNEVIPEAFMIPNVSSQFLHNELGKQSSLKLRKGKTTSCSSSDASDDDNDRRNKDRQTFFSTKSCQGRRDSHDDSSDSQGAGTCSKTSKMVSTRSYSTLCPSTSNHPDKCKNPQTSNTKQHKRSNVKKHRYKNKDCQISTLTKNQASDTLQMFKVLNNMKSVDKILIHILYLVVKRNKSIDLIPNTEVEYNISRSFPSAQKGKEIHINMGLEMLPE